MRSHLGPDDPLPARPARVLVAGTSGSGKTTLAVRIGAVLDLPHTEIEALFHGAGWVTRPEFEDDVRRLVAARRWVTEWLDLPQQLAMTRVVRRTLRRRLRREVLWCGSGAGPRPTAGWRTLCSGVDGTRTDCPDAVLRVR